MVLLWYLMMITSTMVVPIILPSVALHGNYVLLWFQNCFHTFIMIFMVTQTNIKKIRIKETLINDGKPWETKPGNVAGGTDLGNLVKYLCYNSCSGVCWWTKPVQGLSMFVYACVIWSFLHKVIKQPYKELVTCPRHIPCFCPTVCVLEKQPHHTWFV